MKRSTFYQKLLTLSADPAAVAKATADWMERVYSRSMESATYIFSGDSESRSTNNALASRIVVLQDQLSGEATFTVDSVKSAVDGVDLMSSDVIIHVEDTFGDIHDFTVGEVSEQLGHLNDSNYVTWQAFKSLSDYGASPESAQLFLSNLSYTANNVASDIKTTAQQVVSCISSGDVRAALQGISEFVGYAQTIADPEGVVESGESFNVSEYTGVNPVAGWLSGIEFPDLSEGLRVAAGAVVFAAKAVQAVLNSVVNLVGRAFSWLGGFLSRTFVDPQDYKCDDKHLHFFRVPSKARYPVPLKGDPLYNAWMSKDDYDYSVFNGRSILRIADKYASQDLWFMDKGVVSHVWFSDLRYPGDAQGSMFEETYIQPVDPERLWSIIADSDILNIGSSANDNITWNSDTYTPEKFLALVESLGTVDAALENKVDEDAVIRGCAVSLAYSATFCDLRKWVASRILDKDQGLLSEMNVDPSYNVIVGPALLKFFNWLANVLGRKSASVSLTAYGRNLPSSELKKNMTVTNKSFISMIGTVPVDYHVNIGSTSNPVYNASSGVLFTGKHGASPLELGSGINAVSSLDGFLNSIRLNAELLEDYYDDPTGANYGATSWFDYSTGAMETYPHNTTDFPAISSLGVDSCILLGATLDPEISGTEYDGAYIGYSHSAPRSLDLNVQVKTDAENAKAVGDFFKGAAIAVVAVVAAVYVGKVALTLMRKKRETSALLSTFQRQYGDALASGDKNAIAAASANLKRTKMRNLLLNGATGSTLKDTASTAYQAIAGPSNDAQAYSDSDILTNIRESITG